MPNPPPARGANPAPVVEEEQSPFRKAFGVIQQFLLIWMAMQFVTRFFAPKSDTTPPPSPATTDIAGTAGIPPATTVEVTQAYPAWPLGIPVAMHVYLSTSPTGDVFSRKWTSGYRQDQDADLPHFAWKNITYGSYDEERVAEYDVNIPVSVQHNGTLWADIFLTRDGTSPDPSDTSFNPRNVHHIRKLLTHYLPKTKVQKEKNLLGSNEPQEVIEESEPEGDIITSHWHRNLTIALVSDATVIPPKQIPIAMAPYIHLLPDRDQTGTKGFYQPIVFPNDFWHLRSQYIEINTTTPTLPLQITFQPMSYMKFQIFSTMTYSFQEASKQQGVSMGQFDEIKRMLVETNPYFLALTGIVSLLHVLFEFLAFSSDVSHWRHKQELVGVSVRTIVTNVVVQIIVLLYLIDNNEETSWMILMGSGTGVLIEAWKITKAVDISFGASPPGSIIPYSIIIKDKHVLSEDEKKTQEYDKLAFRYVSWAAIPCLAAYTVYSLLYLTHKGWYSFIISTLTSFVYMFGFAQLVPQLIINYKLKSVAHMPMKAMIYKTLSTVVDDLFAFCIKMPILHRLACFRDDVVFLVFLYQRWIYRVDPKRVNEYGQVMGSDADAVTEKKDKGSAKETKKNK